MIDPTGPRASMARNRLVLCSAVILASNMLIFLTVARAWPSRSAGTSVSSAAEMLRSSTALYVWELLVVVETMAWKKEVHCSVDS